MGLLTRSHSGDDNRVWLTGKLTLVCSVQGHGQVYQQQKQDPAYMIVLLKINKEEKAYPCDQGAADAQEPARPYQGCAG